MATINALYDFQEADSHCVITLHPDLNKEPWGEIDGIGASLLDRIRGHMDAHRKSRAFLVNLADLNYMGSALVALVVRLWKAIKEKDGKMAVVNSDEMVLEVLRLSGLEEVWTICETQEMGLQAIGVKSGTVAARGPRASGDGAATIVVQQVAASPASRLWCAASLLLLGTAGVGLFLLATDPPPIDDQRVAMGLLFGGALLGLLPGTVAAARGAGLSRTVGVAAILGCLAMMGTGVAVHPQRDLLFGGTSEKSGTPSAASAQKSQGSAGNQKSTSKTSPNTAKANTPNANTPELNSPKTASPETASPETASPEAAS
ncbi:MAG: STAS domain-containing protein, partial [Planctomycetaceae bacterium]